jgi:putative hydrolase of the HAD superfamily
MTNIRNIIFDLGGIFLNLDYQLTAQAFRRLGVTQYDELFSQHHANPLFEQLETGHLSNEDFFQSIRDLTELPLSDAQITNAWNAMLLDMPTDRITWLQAVAQQHEVYLFSNTNAIHYACFENICRRDLGNIHFNELFRFAGYSHQLGFRKPAADSFRQLLGNLQLNASNTLFIDDTPGNISGAQAAGLNTIFLPPPNHVLELNPDNWSSYQGFTSSKSM